MASASIRCHLCLYIQVLALRAYIRHCLRLIAAAREAFTTAVGRRGLLLIFALYGAMGGAFATINKGLTVMTIIRDLRLLHPKFGRAAGLLHQDLIRAYEAGETKTLFKVFETFRDPRRQLDALKKGVSKAGMYQSAHAFGMAADFVPFLSPYEARRSPTSSEISLIRDGAGMLRTTTTS